MNEHTPKHIVKIKRSSNRFFGLVFSFVFSVIAIYPMLESGAIRIWALTIAGILLSLSLFAPKTLNSANQLWMHLGELMHLVVSPIALGIVFYVTVIPTGLLLRLSGKDPLRLRLDHNAETYWIKRDPPGPTPESLTNQF